MSDDLVKRLWLHDCEGITREAADVIEELEAKLNWVIVERDETFALMLHRAQTAETKLAKAVEAAFEEGFLAGTGDGWVNNPRIEMEWKRSRSRITLAELTGGKRKVAKMYAQINTLRHAKVVKWRLMAWSMSSKPKEKSYE